MSRNVTPITLPPTEEFPTALSEWFEDLLWVS